VKFYDTQRHAPEAWRQFLKLTIGNVSGIHQPIIILMMMASVFVIGRAA
jgi:hypothetical protein